MNQTIGSACSTFDFNTCTATQLYQDGSGQQHCVVGGDSESEDDDGNINAQ